MIFLLYDMINIIFLNMMVRFDTQLNLWFLPSESNHVMSANS